MIEATETVFVISFVTTYIIGAVIIYLAANDEIQEMFFGFLWAFSCIFFLPIILAIVGDYLLKIGILY